MAEAVASKLEPRSDDAGTPPRLGGYTAMAEAAWMGSVQATDVLENARIAPRISAAGRQVARLLTREYTVREASLILMASFFLSALLGAVRQVLFNAQFGASLEANAYYAAFRLPDTLFSLIAGGALSSAMIPVLLSTVRESGQREGARLTGIVLAALLAFFALVVLAGEVFAPAFVQRLLAPGFDPPASQLTVQLTRIMLIQPVILAFSSVATAVLNSRNQFFLTGLSVISHNITLILGILAARANPALGILGPTLGVVGGAVLQGAILLPGLGGTGSPLRLAWDPANQKLREIVRLLIPNGLSVSVNYAGFIVDTAFASQAAEAASLPAIYNAWLLVGLPIALLGQAIGQAAFPRLAAHAAAQDWAQMRRSLLQSLLVAIGMAIPAVAALVGLGRLVIRILFEHGRFDAAAGDLTYSVLVAYSVALPAYVATELVTRGLIALRDTRTPLVTNSLQLLGRIGFLALAVASLGVLAIPVAFAITASLETVALTAVLLVRLHRRIVAVQIGS